MTTREQFDELTSEIICAGIAVHDALGPGLLESTYEKCLAYKMEKAGMEVRRQVVVPITFEELRIPDAYRVDLIVNDSVVVETKSVEKINAIHFAQVLTYLRALDLRVGLIMNFNCVHLRDGLHRVVNKF